MNRGETPLEFIEHIALPPELADKPFLQEFYGCVTWSARAYFEGEMGWFDGNPTSLFPTPRRDKAERLTALAGGADAVLAALKAAQQSGDHQWACELADTLQKFPWQLDLAHVMWKHIETIRTVGVVALVLVFFSLRTDEMSRAIPGSIVLGLIWAGIYWVFNHYWVGRVKFLPLGTPQFASAAESTIDPSLPVIGICVNGVAKAYPTSMLFYHHQVPDEIGGQPIWATYCGLCRSGRIYDRTVDGQTLDFKLVGAITFNAVFEDVNTGSWWRQETGEAVKGPQAGKALADIPFEQMSLENCR